MILKLRVKLAYPRDGDGDKDGDGDMRRTSAVKVPKNKDRRQSDKRKIPSLKGSKEGPEGVTDCGYSAKYREARRTKRAVLVLSTKKKRPAVINAFENIFFSVDFLKGVNLDLSVGV